MVVLNDLNYFQYKMSLLTDRTTTIVDLELAIAISFHSRQLGLYYKSIMAKQKMMTT